MVNLSNLKISETGKHFQADVSIEPAAWEAGESWACKIRVVSRIPLSKKDFDKIVDKTIDNRSKWEATPKGNYQYKLRDYPASSIYITKLMEA